MHTGDLGFAKATGCAVLAAATLHAPGFPDDGSWAVKWEGLKKAP